MSDLKGHGRQRHWCVDLTVFVLLVGLGVFCRWTTTLPNFQPIFAIALFAGYFFSHRWMALLCPLVTMAISDLVLGGYQWELLALVYGCFALGSVIGMVLRSGRSFRAVQRRRINVASVAQVTGAALLVPLIFFLVTNFGVWRFLSIYPSDLSGLLQAYLMGLPFLKNSLMAGLAFSWLLFGGYFLSERLVSTFRVPAMARVANPIR